MAETIIFQSLPPRPAPVNTEGLVPWIRANLFGNWQSIVTTLIVGGLLLYYVPQFLKWAVFTATTVPNADGCRAPGVGACWGVVTEKYRLIIFGRYPFEEQWRPLVATLLMLGLLVASCTRAFWNKSLIVLWVVVLAAFFILMHGGFFGLSTVTTDRWGGLPLTIMLSTLSIVMAFPLALLIALGRRSNLPAIRSFCTIFVELIRGVPLISVRAGGYHGVRRSLHGGSHPRRPAGNAQGPVRGSRFARPVVLADAAQDHPAAGTGDRGAGHHEQLHLAVQGYLARDHRVAV